MKKNIKSTRVYQYLTWWEWEIEYQTPVNGFTGKISGPWATRDSAEKDLRKQ